MAAEVRSPTNEGELRIGIEAKRAYNAGDVQFLIVKESILVPPR